MVIQQKTVTSQEFWEFVNRPENQNRFFERVHGEIVEILPSNTYAPDVAFVSNTRLVEPAKKGFTRIAPDLVVEVVSPGNTAAEIQRKTQDYLKAGGRLVIVAYPDTKSIVVHIHDGAKPREVDAIFDGGEALPGFKLRVGDVFP